MRFNFGIIDLIDILLVAVLLFYVYKLLKGTAAYRLFVGVLLLILAWLVVTSFMPMKLMGQLMNQVMNFGVIAIIVLFQEEIRQFITRIGSGEGRISRLFSHNEQNMEQNDVMQIILACKNMGREKVGALIVIENEMSLQSIVVTGDEVDAKVSSRLIENIFFKNSPLHDGAMVISRGRIKAAGCILPVSHSMEVPKMLGLRHRAALGVSEKLDVKAIIVSEETGKISLAENGTLRHDIGVKDLEMILSYK